MYAVCFQSYVVVYPLSLCYFIVAYLFVRFYIILEGLPVSSNLGEQGNEVEWGGNASIIA